MEISSQTKGRKKEIRHFQANQTRSQATSCCAGKSSKESNFELARRLFAKSPEKTFGNPLANYSSETRNFDTMRIFIQSVHTSSLKTNLSSNFRRQMAETNEPGQFRLWVLVDQELHHLRLNVPRIFYVNTRQERDESNNTNAWKKCHKILPRSRPVYHLYRYSVPEKYFKCHSQ